MNEGKIEYFNRYTGKVEEEKVYGEEYLKFFYGSRVGRICLYLLFSRIWFSKYYGWLMDRAKSAEKIRPFIKEYGVNEGEFLDGVDSFKTFNQFFYRKLKPESRPVSSGVDDVMLPADGRHMVFPDLSRVDAIFVKGQRFDVARLLGSEEEGDWYKGGALVLSRLCPVDYHRFHFPVSGRVMRVEEIKGSLYSVNPMALRQRIGILFENKRVKTEIATEQYGRVMMIEVGATCVGSIVQTFKDKWVDKGSEKGYFKFGGSSTIVLFERGKVDFSLDLISSSERGIEMYGKMGDLMGVRKKLAKEA